MDTQGFTAAQIEALSKPLDFNSVKEREGAGGKKLKYIKTDSAIDTANRIFGYGRWGYKIVSRSKDETPEGKAFYTCEVELSVVGCPFTFPGDGVGVVTGKGVEAYEKAFKEASSDALKRALRHYGDQFGLCLYDATDLVDVDGALVPVGQAQVQKNKPMNAKPVQKPEAPQHEPEMPRIVSVNEEPPTTAEIVDMAKQAGYKSFVPLLKDALPLDRSIKDIEARTKEMLKRTWTQPERAHLHSFLSSKLAALAS